MSRIGSIGVLTIGLLGAAAEAQIVFEERFEGDSIASLEAAGWSFRNQSDAANQLGWDVDSVGAPDGLSWLEAGPFVSDLAGGAEVSSWAVLPVFPGAQAGIPIRFMATGFYTNPPRHDILELRYSASGGTSTGSDGDDVGDFTQVLWTGASSQLGLAWSGQEVALPGPGRLALRYWRADGAETGRMGVDAISVGEPASPGALLPSAGQTLTWTAAMSPIVFEADATIPQGATVIVEPGVVLRLQSQAQLHIDGTLRGVGADTDRIVIEGTPALAVTGTVDLSFATIAGRIGRSGEGAVLLTDCTITPVGNVDGVGGRHSTMVLERCEIQTDWFAPWGNIAIRDCTFAGTLFAPSGYVLVDGLEAHTTVELVREYQNMLVDNVHVSNAPGPALQLRSAHFGAADFLLGPNNTLVGNEYPVATPCGLVPGSVVPASGNAHNAVRLGGNGTALRYNRITWPDVGVPYHVMEETTISGGLHIEPGVTLRFAPQTDLLLYATQGDHIIRGLPGRPIRFTRLDPNQEWFAFGIAAGVNLVEYLHVDGAGVGVSAPQSTILLRDAVISNCAIGTLPSGLGEFLIKGTQYLNNQVGARGDDFFSGYERDSGLNSPERPNLFEGNTLAAEGVAGSLGVYPYFDARYCWWGDETGPQGDHNPAGQGDSINFGVTALPFLDERPDLTSDYPPTVRLLTRPYPWGLPGTPIMLEWEASDDRGIVSQEIHVQLATSVDFTPLVTGLPGHLRRLELILPAGAIRFRLIATDTANQTSIEPWEILVPHAAPAGTVAFTTDVAAGFAPGEEIDICYSAFGMSNSPQTLLELGADERWMRGPAGNGGDRCTFSQMRIPRVSTDRARLVMDGSGGNERELYFGAYFEIRPSALLGDVPPNVEMLTPATAASFQGGSTIPITWSASDDESLRSFKIQASFDGGHAWHTIRRDLPGDVRRLDWRLPASNGVPDLRIRVVAIDHRFQNSTDGDDRTFAILPGDASCPADLDGDGAADVFDLLAYLDQWFAGEAAADRTGDGATDVFDLLAYLDVWFAGC